MEQLDQTTKEYQAGLNYQRRMGFTENWNRYTDFKEMRMWPVATDKTRNLPRITIPLIPFILKHKIAVVNSKPLKLTYKPIEVLDENDIANKASEEFTKFAETEWRRMKQDEANGLMLNDAGTIGTGLLHFYFDGNKSGGYKSKYIGEMCVEVIDPMCFFPGNPQEDDIEKQPYFNIAYRDSVNNIKKQAKDNGVAVEKIEMITPDKKTDEIGYDAAKIENELQQDATVLCRYWKENGVVYFKKVCQEVEIVSPTKYWGDLPAEVQEIYPVSSMNWELRKYCFFGTGEVEGLIENNKSMNFIKSMQVKNVQDTAWSKWIVENDALKGQVITNEPGQILFDKSANGTKDNIRPMSAPSMNGQASQIATEILDMSRSLTGVNEAATGEPFTRDLNAQALEGMRAASAIPINEIQKRYYYCVEKIGRIYELMWKTKYKLPRTVKVENELGEESNLTFKGSQYLEIPLELMVDVGASTNEKDATSTQRIDNWLQQQLIDFSTALELYPKDEVPFKETLKEMMKMNVSQQGETPVHQFLKQLPPEEQERILAMPEQEQVAYVRQMMGGNANAMQEM